MELESNERWIQMLHKCLEIFTKCCAAFVNARNVSDTFRKLTTWSWLGGEEGKRSIFDDNWVVKLSAYNNCCRLPISACKNVSLVHTLHSPPAAYRNTATKKISRKLAWKREDSSAQKNHFYFLRDSPDDDEKSTTVSLTQIQAIIFISARRVKQVENLNILVRPVLFSYARHTKTTTITIILRDAHEIPGCFRLSLNFYQLCLPHYRCKWWLNWWSLNMSPCTPSILMSGYGFVDTRGEEFSWIQRNIPSIIVARLALLLSVAERC